ncbi:MAG: GNAT family N-acetyltransferase [Christensenellaceae bacterium]|jgi:putative acetyltransferase
MIEGFQPTDMKEIMRLWRTGNQAAHDFIAQAYWEGHEKQVEEMMPLSELYVYRKEAEIKGFIGISEASYIAGLFVDAAAQNMGIGSALLSYCKRR